MNFFIEFPFFLKYLADAEYMINSRPVASNATLMIPNNFLRKLLEAINEATVGVGNELGTH